MENNQNQAKAQELEQKESFFSKNKKVILYAVIAIIVIILGCLLYSNFIAKPREDKASTTLAKSQQLFDNGDYEKALNGDKATSDGFLKIASEYSSTKAGNLAKYYAGICYANLGKWKEAVDYLEKYSPADDQMFGPASRAALGNAYAHLKQYDKAVSLLKEAADKADNNSISPAALIQAGEILESQGKKDEALKCYQQIKEKYVNSMAYQTIDKYIERASMEK